MRSCKLYNFRRPDKFSKDHLRALQTLHENFARQFGLLLTAYLRLPVEVNVVSVDQLTYDEFIRSMPSPMTVNVMEMNPLPGQILFGFGFEVTSSMIDRMLGGPGASERKARELTDIEHSLIRRIVDRGLRTLEEAWRSVMHIETKIVGTENSYALIQVATPGEIVALVTFDINIGAKESGLVSLCFPYPVLEGMITQLSAQHIFHGAQQQLHAEQEEVILNKLQYARIPIQVYLGGTQIAVRDLLELTPGDVIALDREMQDDLLISINARPKFLGRPGTRKNNLAIYVTQEVYDEEAIEGFWLYGNHK